MEHEDNIEYAKGGRISPEQSATIPPLGTFGIGNNEDVWITQADKNGRESWKPTEIKKDKFYIIKWNGFVDAESIDFDIKFPNFKWKLRYLYNQPSYCELRFTSDYNKELEGSLNDLKIFFITQFSVDKFNETRGDIIWSGFDVYQEVIDIINILEKLQSTGKLRNPNTPNPEFEFERKLTIDFDPERYYVDINKKLPDGSIQKTLFLNFTNFKYILPAYASKEFITFGSSVKANFEFDILIAVTLDYEKGFSFLIEAKDGRFPTFKIDEITEIDSFLRLYKNNVYPLLLKETNEFLCGELDMYIYSLFDYINKNKIANWLHPEWFDDKLPKAPENPTPETPQPKFKVGDKVKRIGENKVMTVVKQIYDNNKKMFDYDLEFNGVNDKEYFENELELYVSEKSPFQQIDFLNPSTEELDILIKGMQNYSDDLHFINSTLANIQLKLKNRTAYIKILFDKVNNIIKLSEPSRNINAWSTEIQQKITNESISEISELYVQTLTKLLEYIEKDNPQDCEADPSLIVSGQVKKFYDLNKPRIEKLKSEFSCKIIKALVSLSEYEKCGTPSKIKLPLQKEDLLSEIKNLKF